MIRRGGLVVSLVMLGAATMLGGCNRSAKQQAALAQQESAELREKNAALEATLGERNNRIAELEGRVSQLQAAPPSQPGWNTNTGRTTYNDRGANTGGGSFTRDGAGNARATISGDVLFDSGQVTIKPAAKRELDKIATEIRRSYAGANIRIEGYTDTDPIRKSKWGSNEALSQARADAVRDYLSGKGVNATSMGMGSANPKSTKAASRRVEIVVLR
ncbi:MAG: membrane protein [Phycisphaerae bacterium]|nr:MAG: membrane protein [Phycisphaerae bacterium]